MGLRGPKPSCECGTCSKCLTRARERRWRLSTPEKQREYRKQRKAYTDDYYQKNRDRLSAASLARYHAGDELAHLKHNARQKAWRAIKAGHLSRENCESCGAEKVQAHHDDYSKPLEVRWLCSPCHHAEHAEMRRAA